MLLQRRFESGIFYGYEDRPHQIAVGLQIGCFVEVMKDS